MFFAYCFLKDIYKEKLNNLSKGYRKIEKAFFKKQLSIII